MKHFVYGLFNLLTDLIEFRGTFSIFQLKIHGVAEQREAASWPQNPVCLPQEERMVEPVSSCHRYNQVDNIVLKGQLLCRTLSNGAG